MSEPLANSASEPQKRRRRKHSKSRQGCTNCKRLRVKCGEEKPQCRNCVKRNATCIYKPVVSANSKSGQMNVHANVASSTRAFHPAGKSSSSESSSSESERVPSLAPIPESIPKIASEIVQQMQDMRFPLDPLPHYLMTDPSVSYPWLQQQMSYISSNVAVDPVGSLGNSFNANALSLLNGFLSQTPPLPILEEGLPLSTMVWHDAGLSSADATLPSGLSLESDANDFINDRMDEEHFHSMTSDGQNSKTSHQVFQHLTAISRSIDALAAKIVRYFSMINSMAVHMPVLIPPDMFPSSTDPRMITQLIHHHVAHCEEFLLMTNPQDVPLWKEHVPRMSLSHPGTLHSLLALAASHYSHVEPHRSASLRRLAIQHFKQSLIVWSEINQMSCGNPDGGAHGESLFISSCLILILASSLPECIPLISTGTSPDILDFMIAPIYVLLRYRENIVGSKLNPMVMTSYIYVDTSKLDNPNGNVFQKLIRICCIFMEKNLETNYYGYPVSPVSDSQSPLTTPEPEAQSHRQSQTQVTQSIHGNTNHAPIDYEQDPVYWPCHKSLTTVDFCIRRGVLRQSCTDMIQWMMGVNEDFLGVLRSGHSFAKIIVMYFLATISIKREFFWIGERVRIELPKLASELDSFWAPLAEWPLSMLQAPPAADWDELWERCQDTATQDAFIESLENGRV